MFSTSSSLPASRRQRPIGRCVLAGRRVIPDFRWPAQRLILEVDSTAWHTDPLARADDRERQALLEAHGETVLRVHWLDAVMAPTKLASLLTAKGAPPARVR